MNAAKRPPTAYGPLQLSAHTGLDRFQVDRARAAGLIPEPDRSGGKWSAAVVEDIAAHAEEIRQQVGTVPDVGSERAADYLSGQLGMPVTPDAVVELGRQGVIPVVGDYKGHDLFCGRALEAFDDVHILLGAALDGEQVTADEAAARLKIRRSDFDHLTRAGLVAPASWVRNQWQPRHASPRVPLYRAGDLRDLAKRQDIDWAAVRAVSKGGRSALADLPTRKDSK